jgi:mitogen-activated protein kinase 1/3
MSEKPSLNVNFVNLKYETQDRYQFNKVIGRGAYGVVLSATEKATRRDVALKRVERIFESANDAKRVLREIRILSRLKHENITNIFDVCAAPEYAQFHSIILVMDLMDTDMFQIINSGQALLADHHRYFIYQLLRGLKYIHSANVLHRDLKPGNLLLNANCDLKIADFGLARVLNPDNPEEDLSEYVATRWYRAPEILLIYADYGPGMDLWSVGCILAELIQRKPLFKGSSTINQLTVINEIIGSPTDEDLELCTNGKARSFMRSLPRIPPRDMATLFPGANPEAIDLIAKLLVWDPRKRISVEEALEHPFVQHLHDPFDEPVGYPIPGFEFEREDITMEELKWLLWQEVVARHPEFQGTQ